MSVEQKPQRDSDGDDIGATAAEWVIRLDAEPEARAELSLWLAEDPRHAAAFAKAQRIWGLAADIPAVTVEATPVRRSRLSLRPQLAAALLAAAVAFAAFGLGWQRPDLWQSLTADYATLQGAQRSFFLPDGSEVMLDAGSAIDYAEDDDARLVTLLGGAGYFDVAHDGRSFTVVAGQDSVRALGTRFDVRRDGAGTTVTLEDGVVEVTSPLVPAHRLEPGQQIRLEADRGMSLNVVDPDQAIDWRNGSFVFYDLPLSEICALLSRHGAGPIVIPDPVLGGRRISGRLVLGQPRQELEALSAALGFRIRNVAGTKILM